MNFTLIWKTLINKKNLQSLKKYAKMISAKIYFMITPQKELNDSFYQFFQSYSLLIF